MKEKLILEEPNGGIKRGKIFEVLNHKRKPSNPLSPNYKPEKKIKFIISRVVPNSNRNNISEKNKNNENIINYNYNLFTNNQTNNFNNKTFNNFNNNIIKPNIINNKNNKKSNNK